MAPSSSHQLLSTAEMKQCHTSFNSYNWDSLGIDSCLDVVYSHKSGDSLSYIPLQMVPLTSLGCFVAVSFPLRNTWNLRNL